MKKEFAKYTSLNIIAMVSVSFYILVDTFFISWGIGAYGLAALNFAIPVWGIIMGCGLMLGIGGATKYAVLKSQNETADANQFFTSTIILMLIFSAFFVACGVFFADIITAILGTNSEVFHMSRTYLQTLLLFSPMILVNTMLVCFARNDGAPRLAMLVMVSNSFVNIGLDYIFIIQQEMGMFGAALATGLANTIGVVILVIYFIWGNSSFRLVRCKITKSITFGIFATGLPSLIAEASISVVMVAFNIVIFGLSGNIGVAAFGIIANILIVVTAIYNGIAQGIQPLISKYHGSGSIAAVKSILRYALILTAIISAIIYTAVFFGANQIANIFNSEQNELLQSLAIMGIRIYFAGTVFAGFNIIITMYFTSIENPRPAHIISMLRGFIIILPLVFLLSATGGITGVWFAFPITEAIVAVVSCGFYYFYRTRLETIKKDS